MDYIHRHDLISAAQLADLRERCNWRAGAHLLGHALLILLTGTALYLAIFGGALYAQSWAPLLYWIGPLLIARGTHEIQNLVEHSACAPVSDVLLNSRVIRCNMFMHWMGWNMPYHCHHHLFAAVPFYRLPELDKLIGERLPQPLSYWQAFNEIRRGRAPQQALDLVAGAAPSADVSGAAWAKAEQSV